MVRMPINCLRCVITGLLLGVSVCAAQAQNVFACEPEWAALAKVLLPQAKLFVATHARQDPHHIEARPALIAQLRAAEVAVCTGAELEAGWLPTLQQRAGNAKVQDGAPGMFYAADNVVLIDPQPLAIGSPFAGDVHAAGNPHLHTDPHRILAASQALAEQLQKLQPAQKQAIAQRQAEFEIAWKTRITAWERRAAPLRGREVAAQHSSFAYLWRWLGMKQVADLEPQPGMAPTPGHLQRLLTQLRAKPPLAVVVSSYQDPRSGRWLVGQLGGNLPLLVLPATVMDASSPDALGLWFDQLLDELLKTREH
jgi:zinc/manganese transport system substrate-binding protein